MFFYEKPEQVPPGSVVEMAMFEDSVWGKIAILDYPQLSEAAKKYAIPTRKIKNGEDILKGLPMPVGFILPSWLLR